MRLFIGLPLPHEVESELGRIIAHLKTQGGRVTWVAPENIHMTVRFLGETDDARVPKLTALINEVAQHLRPAHLQIDRLGGFPNIHKPRVIWAGVTPGSDVDRLEKMARHVELEVRQMRFGPDQKGFKAHLTLGRVKDPSNLQQLASVLGSYRVDPIKVHLDRLVLFKSTLTPQGSIYERLHEAILGEERLEG